MEVAPIGGTWSRPTGGSGPNQSAEDRHPVQRGDDELGEPEPYGPKQYHRERSNGETSNYVQWVVGSDIDAGEYEEQADYEGEDSNWSRIGEEPKAHYHRSSNGSVVAWEAEVICPCNEHFDARDGPIGPRFPDEVVDRL